MKKAWKTAQSQLKKLSMKMWLQIILCNFIKINFAGSFLVLIISITSKIVPIVFLKEKIFVIILILNLFILIKSVFDKPGLKEVALCGDKLGLQEKLITYLEFKGKENSEQTDEFKIFQDDLEDELQDFHLINKYKIRINHKIAAAVVMINLLCFGIYFISSVSSDSAKESEKIHMDIKNEALNIKDKSKDIIENMQDENIKKKSLSVLNELNQKLNRSYDYDAAAEEIEKAEEKLWESRELQNTALSERSSALGKDDKVSGEEISDRNGINNEDLKNHIENKTNDSETVEKNETNSLENKSSDEVKLKEEMDSSKSKLISKKDKENFERGNGNKMADEFSLGEKKEAYSYGEKSDVNDIHKNVTGNGTEKKEDNNAVGSSKTGDNSEVREKANNGTIEKGEASSDTHEDESSKSFADSKVSNEGKLLDKGLGQVDGQNGEKKAMGNMLLKYKKELNDSMLKAQIPVDKESLVIDYYNELNK